LNRGLRIALWVVGIVAALALLAFVGLIVAWVMSGGSRMIR
jgi:hypothetical protein